MAVTPGNEPQSGPAKALGVIDDYTKLLIALATGVVVLSATFMGEFYRGQDIWSVVIAWVLCGVSSFAGLLARGAYISQLTAGRHKPRRDTLELLNMIQWVSLVVGVGFLGNAVIANVNAAPRVFTLATSAPITAGASNIQISCRTGDSNGCHLEVHVSTLTVPITSGPTTLAQIPSDAAASVHVVLPPSIVAAARARGQAIGTVTIVASGRIGSTSTTLVGMNFVKPGVLAHLTKPVKHKKKHKKKKKKKHKKKHGRHGATGLTGTTSSTTASTTK